MSEKNERPGPLRLITGRPSESTHEDAPTDQGYQIGPIESRMIDLICTVYGQQHGPEAAAAWIRGKIDAEIEGIGSDTDSLQSEAETAASWKES